MIKQNTTNSGFFGKIESIIRVIPHIYIIFRMLVRFTNYFEEDFLYLKKIFNNRKVNIIDVGASDGISVQFFLRNLKCKKIFCYEPQKVFFLKLTNLKKRFNNLVLFNYGLAKKNFKMDIFYPFVSFFGFKVFLLTYSFPIKKELEDQIDLDFFIKPGIQKSKILVKKYKIQNDKIDLIKIDTNGSEYEIVETLFRLIKRDKPVLIIENNNISKIFKNLKKLGYKKYYVINDILKKHTNQNSANIIFK